MTNKIAQVVSFLLHPLLLPLYALLIIYQQKNYILYFNIQALLVVSLFTCVVPALILFLLKKRKVAEHLNLYEREIRNIPLAIVIILYYIAYFFIKQQFVPPIFILLMLCIIIIMLIVIIVNLLVKIDLHALSIAVMLAGIIQMSSMWEWYAIFYVSVLTLLSGVVCWSRLQLQKSTLGEVYKGYIIGFVSMYLFMGIYAFAAMGGFR